MNVIIKLKSLTLYKPRCGRIYLGHSMCVFVFLYFLYIYFVSVDIDVQFFCVTKSVTHKCYSQRKLGILGILGILEY